MNNVDLKKLQNVISTTLEKVLEERGKLLIEANELKEQEVEMLKFQLYSIIMQAKEVHDLLDSYPFAPAWAEAKITTAYNMISKIRTYMITKVQQEKDKMIDENIQRAVGDTDPTNFPKKKITKK